MALSLISELLIRYVYPYGTEVIGRLCNTDCEFLAWNLRVLHFSQAMIGISHQYRVITAYINLVKR